MFGKITEYLSTLQGITMLIIIAASLLFVLLERLIPYHKGQKIIREGFFNDFVLYTVLQSYVLGLIIFAFLNYLKIHTGLYRYSILSSMPIWFQLVILLVFHDFYIYWFHRWMHHNKYLWRLHEAHHSTQAVDWLSGSRSHALEILINQTVEFAPIILLGASPEVAILKGTISAIWGMFIHCNIDVRLGKLQYIINGPEMHRWHHSDDGGREFQSNYATKFAFWDWIFGTGFFPNPDERKPKFYGLSDTPDYPLRYTNRLFEKYKKKERKGIAAFFGGIIIVIESLFINIWQYILQQIAMVRKYKYEKTYLIKDYTKHD